MICLFDLLMIRREWTTTVSHSKLKLIFSQLTLGANKYTTIISISVIDIKSDERNRANLSLGRSRCRKYIADQRYFETIAAGVETEKTKFPRLINICFPGAGRPSNGHHLIYSCCHISIIMSIYPN